MKLEAGLSLEELASTVAHEIRNPIALIKAYLQVLEEDDSYVDKKTIFSILHRELDKINDLAGDMMDLTNPKKYHFEVVDIIDLIQGIVKLFSVKFSDHLQIDFQYSGESIFVHCDVMKMQQVFINVIKNAVEAFEETEGIVKILVTKEITKVKIVISDNGPGFCDEIGALITTPFFTTKPTGNGVGLSFCKKIIQEHQGDFQIKSIVEQGTDVIINLPCCEVMT